MKYVYPKLSEIDLYLTRVGGLGLGNMLFTYAKALLYARDEKAQMIWPTWNSIPIGQILRNEQGKRFYFDLFQNSENAVSGIKKVWLLTFCKKDICFFSGMEGEFEPIKGKENSVYIRTHLKKILKKKNRDSLGFQPGNAICMHVRLGDFTRGTEEEIKAGRPNMSIPIEWYAGMVKQIRSVAGKVPVYVFSDGTKEELKLLLEMENVYQMTYGTAISDIMAMSNAKMFIASGSTFSRWVRFLGRMSTITYPGQLKQCLLDEEDDAFEIEAEMIPEDYLKRIQELLTS